MNIARQIRRTGGAAPKMPPKKSSDYLAFIRLLPCAVTGRTPVEAAHLSKAAPEWGHAGRGKAQRASDRWALPLTKAKHDEQHSGAHKGGEMAFWDHYGIDPHRLACTLWGLWCERGEEALGPCVKIIKGKAASK